MSENDWPATGLVLDAAKAFPDQVEDINDFAEDARKFSTWYFAISDRARMPAEDFMKSGFPTVARVQKEIPLPPQTLYAQTEKIAEDFMNGVVDVRELEQLSKIAAEVSKNMQPVIQDVIEGRGNYLIGLQGNGIPKVLSDALYPEKLTGLIKYYMEEGVVQMSPIQRELLNALIVDEASLLQRIPKNSKPLPPVI